MKNLAVLSIIWKLNLGELKKSLQKLLVQTNNSKMLLRTFNSDQSTREVETKLTSSFVDYAKPMQ